MRWTRLMGTSGATMLLLSSFGWAELQVTILLDAFDGCGCGGEFEDPIACPACPDGVIANYPDPDACDGQDNPGQVDRSIDPDWFNLGWPADFFRDNVTPLEGFAAQCFQLGVPVGHPCGTANNTFDATARTILAYDGAAFGTPGHASVTPFDIEAARIAQGLPEPDPDGPSYLTVDRRRVDTIAQPTAVTAIDLFAFSVEVHPEATGDLNFIFAPAEEREIPNDGQWHDAPVLLYDKYLTSIGTLAVTTTLEPSGFAPPAGSGITVCYDNLRYVYTMRNPCPHDPVFDVDDDGDVDQTDFARFQLCLTGSNPAPGVFDALDDVCKCMDVTGPQGEPDGAIDELDFLLFLECALGPDIPAVSGCDVP